MTDVPGDRKDWTWVLDRPCPECGLVASDLPVTEVAPRLRATTASWVTVLARADVRERPRPGVWSPLEYACHVHDVHVLYDERLRLMLETDDPLYEDWDQDAAALAADYGAQDPDAVARALRASGLALADRFDTVHDWERPGRRTDGASFTVASFARYLLHDVEHHLWDVGGG
ncbi:MAG: hypothetical protein JWO60_1198 [Frankiales bacterium]|nr:hypothetical protein [Frankiales bacterium]